MKSLVQIRVEFQIAFGPNADVIMAAHAELHVYCFLVRISPLESKAITEDAAWGELVRVVNWLAFEQRSLKSPNKIEIMAGVLKPPRIGKLRIFRVGGTISELLDIFKSTSREAVGGGSYVYNYDSWTDGIASLQHA